MGKQENFIRLNKTTVLHTDYLRIGLGEWTGELHQAEQIYSATYTLFEDRSRRTKLK